MKVWPPDERIERIWNRLVPKWAQVQFYAGEGNYHSPEVEALVSLESELAAARAVVEAARDYLPKEPRDYSRWHVLSNALSHYDEVIK